MSDHKNNNLIVISVEKLNTIYNKYSIPEHIKDIEETYIEALESKWIRSKQMFYFIHNGEILPSDTKLKSINGDIILLTCNNLTEFKTSSLVSNNSVLLNDISDLLGRTGHTTSASTILPYMNPSDINSNISQPIVPFNSLDTLSSVLENGNSIQTVFNSVSENNVNSGSQLMHEFRTTMRNMLNSVNVVIDNDTENPNQTLLTDGNNSQSEGNVTSQSTIGSEQTSIIDTPTDSTTETPTGPNIDTPTDVITSEYINSSSTQVILDSNQDNNEDSQIDNNNQGQQEDVIDNINNEGTNAELINNTVTQLLNIYNTNVNSGYNSLLSRYSEQIEQMRNLGFTDENKILISLHVSEGNFENAVNYYLSLPDD